MSKLNELINKFCPQGVEYVRLGDLCKIETGKLNANQSVVNGTYNFFTTSKQISKINIYRWDCEAILLPGNANLENIKYYKGKFNAYQRVYVLYNFSDKVNPKFLYYMLLCNFKKYLDGNTNDATITYVVVDTIKQYNFPLPPLRVQEEIVKILDKFTDLENELENELRMRKMQFNAYRDKLLTFDKNGGVKFEKINTCYKLYSGMSGVSQKWQESGNCKFIDYKNVYNHLKIDVHDKPYANVKKLSQNIVRQYDILITAASEIPNECAITAVVEENIEAGVFLDDHLFGMHLIDNKVNSTFVNYYMQTQSFKNDVRKKVKGVTRFYVSPSDIGTLTIPVPPLEKQKEIVEKLDKFNDMCNEISDGLPLEIELRKKQKKYILNKLLNI